MNERSIPHALVADLNDRAFRHGITIAEMLKAAGIPASTWMRWRRGGNPTLASIDRCTEALDRITDQPKKEN